MDIRKESISSQKLCRFCLNQNDSLSSLYDRIKAPKDGVPLSLKILSCVGIEVFPSDKMPQYICQHCKFFMDISYKFKQICRQADENILQFIQNGKPVVAVPWSAVLKKIYKGMSSMNSNEVGVMETVTQSGDTVQVMAEEISDSEEGEDDSIYNVKVRDGPEEGKRIKVVTSDKEDEKKRSRKDSEENYHAVRPANLTRGGSGRCWPCDECDSAYPLEQLLSLHKAQKHRTRNITCDECDAKFFTKYDLVTHQLTHSDEMPFQCIACGKKFRRLILLKRHEKLMHSELPKQECPDCPATFLSVEELEAHQQRHNVHIEKPHVCGICNKKFHEKYILHKHILGVHKKKTVFSCQYCTERFSTVSKLVRHVKAHAGERPYPCKHCDKSFIKSHHYTRHLRMKHSDPHNQGVTSSPYRCEECAQTFSTQDEVMYHSALHATRNLVCPLCQEKFDSVDTVTAHIKSHVNGNQFMCDFCELIFTSKEKLEFHLASAHEDELLANEQDMELDEISMEMDEDEDDDNSINLKEEGDHMVVEIKKADEFMLPAQEEEDKNDNTHSEESELETTYEEMKSDLIEKALTRAIPTLETKIDSTPKVDESEANKQKPAPAPTPVVKPTTDVGEKQTATILKKAEEIKRKVIEQQSSATSFEKSVEKKSNNNKVESSTSTSGASEKSLRLLEKELQDLKRTNSRNEASKTPLKTVEGLRKRPLLHTSTPKTRNLDRKEVTSTKSTPDKTPVSDKRHIERRSTPKDNLKESKDTKDTAKDSKDKDTVTKDSKDTKDTTKDSKDKDTVTKDSKDTKDTAKDSKDKDTVTKDAKEKDIVAKDAKEKDTITKDSKEKDTVTKGVKEKDTVTKDVKEKDTVTKNAKETKDPITKETKEVAKDAKEVKDPKNTKDAVAKESKEIKDLKETKTVKGDKEDNSGKEATSKAEKESKEKANTKASIKNGINDKTPEEAVRRSTRPSKIKDYAKMIRDDQSTTDDESDREHNDDDYHESDKPAKVGTRRGRKSTSKPPATPTKSTSAPQTPTAVPKKRGRPRKVQTPSTPAKVRKTESSELTDKSETVDENETPNTEKLTLKEEQNSPEDNVEDAAKAAQSKLMMSPTGQTLKKVPIRALPPGVKPLPLPRTMGPGEVCEMQIGAKLVKVQKIVMTKGEVEAMAKRGLVEMKEGTMVLKQGVRLTESLKAALASGGEIPPECLNND